MKGFTRVTLALLMTCAVVMSAFSGELKIARDKTPLKEGAGNFYENITILRSGTKVKDLGNAKDDPSWIQVSYDGQKGYISQIALAELAAKSSDPFADMDFSFDTGKKSTIAPASYTAAIKGFAIDYSRRKGYAANDMDKIWEITEFKPRHFFKVRKETKLAYFPRDDELIGVEEAFINDRMNAIGLSVSMGVLEQGVIMDVEMTRRMNIIANIINRQTVDYDVQYRVWIIRDDEPVAFSGPGGFIFFSDTLLKTITDYRELTAIVAHEVGHIIMRHGIKDLAIEQARYSAEAAFDELEMHMDSESLAISDELEEIVDQAVKACVLVRDDIEEFEADDISVELLYRYKLDKKYLKSALQKVLLQMGNKYPRYKDQITRRIARIDGMR
jgi:hypothetical protein